MGGFASLLIGAYLMVAKKGDKKHKQLGKIYFYSMLAAALVSFPMAIMHPNYFLFIVGVFTSYMLLTGTRYLKKKKIEDVNSTDWLLTGFMLLFGFGFIGFGIFNLIKGFSFGVVFLVFGVISLFFVRVDYQNYKGISKVKNYWLTTHIQRMVGSYIASATAFLVVNKPPVPEILSWLLPTIILIPLIIKWSRKYSIHNK
jgi:uncharacterized membrane protein